MHNEATPTQGAAVTTFDNYQPPSEPERPSHADENLGGGSDPRTDGTLSCPICHGTSFIQEESRQEGRWGFTSHVMTLFVCQQCRFVLHFYDTHSPWTT